MPQEGPKDGRHVHPGSEYTPDEVDFLRAIDRARTRGRRFLTNIELLRLAESLGWRRMTLRERKMEAENGKP